MRSQEERILMPLRLLFFAALFALSSYALAGDAVSHSPDGVVTWTPAAPGAQFKGEYAASRWGMFDLEAQLESAAAGKIKISLGGKDTSGTSDGASTSVKIARIYLEKDGK